MIFSLVIVVTLPRESGIRTLIGSIILRSIFLLGPESTLCLLGVVTVSLQLFFKNKAFCQLFKKCGKNVYIDFKHFSDLEISFTILSSISEYINGSTGYYSNQKSIEDTTLGPLIDKICTYMRFFDFW